jgi:hypothetical protein
MPYLTAYGALVDIGHLRADDVILVTAPASSVGLAAIQVAIRLGASAIAVTDDDAASERLLEAGAAEVVNASHGGLVDVVMSRMAGRGADITFDAVAGPGVQLLAAATKQDGISSFMAPCPAKRHHCRASIVCCRCSSGPTPSLRSPAIQSDSGEPRRSCRAGSRQELWCRSSTGSSTCTTSLRRTGGWKTGVS